MPLYFKNKQGLHLGIHDNSKLTQVLKEFNNPKDQDCVIYIDCDELFYYQDFEAYNLEQLSNE
jgi:hypothetical protein